MDDSTQRMAAGQVVGFSSSEDVDCKGVVVLLACQWTHPLEVLSSRNIGSTKRGSKLTAMTTVSD